MRRSADGGGDLFFGSRGWPEVLRRLADSLAIFGRADVVIEVGERSVAQKLKLVFTLIVEMGKADGFS